MQSIKIVSVTMSLTTPPCSSHTHSETCRSVCVYVLFVGGAGEVVCRHLRRKAEAASLGQADPSTWVPHINTHEITFMLFLFTLQVFHLNRQTPPGGCVAAA